VRDDQIAVKRLDDLSASDSLILIIASVPSPGNYLTSKADISIEIRPDILTLR